MNRIALPALLMLSAVLALPAAKVGDFKGQGDIGAVLHPGSVAYDRSTKTYTVNGSGENMWFGKDEFYYVWKRVSAKDISIAAEISMIGDTGDGHRKGVLMIRQSLDTDSPYVDVARHGDGLTSLQYRETKGANTREVESDLSGPTKLRLEKRGDRFFMWLAAGNDLLKFAGGSAKMELHAPFYIGIGVCAHNKNNVQRVAFKNVEISKHLPHTAAGYSTVETVLMSGDARVGYVSHAHLEAAGWSAGGHDLTFKDNGQVKEVPFSPLRTAAPVGEPATVERTDFDYYSDKGQIWRKQKSSDSAPEQITSDDRTDTSPHLSPDGKRLVYLSSSGTDVELKMISLADKKTTTLAPFVGGPGSLGDQPWSPDGRRVVFISYQDIR